MAAARRSALLRKYKPPCQQPASPPTGNVGRPLPGEGHPGNTRDFCSSSRLADFQRSAAMAAARRSPRPDTDAHSRYKFRDVSQNGFHADPLGPRKRTPQHGPGPKDRHAVTSRQPMPVKPGEPSPRLPQHNSPPQACWTGHGTERGQTMSRSPDTASAEGCEARRRRTPR